jgi:hypothetical protein
MSSDQSYQAYGRYLVTWNRLNAVLDASIIKETGISPAHGVLLVGSLTYKSRLGVLRSLLGMAGGAKADAIPLLTEIAQNSKRQPIVQGAAADGPAGSLSFTRHDLSVRLGAAVVTYQGDELESAAEALATDIAAIQQALGVTEADLAQIAHVMSATLAKRRKDKEAESADA